MLADDRVLGQENGCGYVHRHDAGQGEGEGGGGDDTIGMVTVMGGRQDPRI
jgi:hypothetical protein